MWTFCSWELEFTSNKLFFVFVNASCPVRPMNERMHLLINGDYPVLGGSVMPVVSTFCGYPPLSTENSEVSSFWHLVVADSSFKQCHYYSCLQRTHINCLTVCINLRYIKTSAVQVAYTLTFSYCRFLWQIKSLSQGGIELLLSPSLVLFLLWALPLCTPLLQSIWSWWHPQEVVSDLQAGQS